MQKKYIMTKSEICSKIIKNEMIIMKAHNSGHRPNDADEFQPLRIENEILRCLYFGEDSPHCMRNYTNKKGDQ
jgi:hypothetical protein|tara:strand:- start:682 stop:900 length:219 start_codon:yes stop_codon:yes gene_type:complete